MKPRDTKIITVRVKITAWERFQALCKESGFAPNMVINCFINSGSVLVKPATETRPAQGHAPTGYHAVTGEPIFKRGVGPKRSKK